MSDPKVDAAFQDGRVQDGINAEYLNQSRDQPAITAVIFVTTATSILLIARLLSRIFLVRGFGWDDALAFLSWVCTSSTVIRILILT